MTPTPTPSNTPTPGRPQRPGGQFRPAPRLGPALGVSPAWERETSKCIGREVTVTQLLGVDQVGRAVVEHTTGICLALQMQHLSVILMTDTEKVLLKNVHQIRRVRAKNNPPKPEPGVGELTQVLGEALAGAKEE